MGAGGLGAPTLLYLAGAGIGHLRVVDCDVVAMHNLHRQVLYTEMDIDQPKASMACKRLQAMNAEICATPIRQRLTEQNAAEIIGKPTIIVDCTDNIDTRLVIDKYAKSHGIPWIYGSIGGWQGQCSVLNHGASPRFYTDLLENIPHLTGTLPPPAVYGALPGVVGAMEASEGIKVLLGKPDNELLVGRLWWINLSSMETRIFRF